MSGRNRGPVWPRHIVRCVSVLGANYRTFISFVVGPLVSMGRPWAVLLLPIWMGLLAAGSYRPVVIMHGIGDSSADMAGLCISIQARYPGIYAWAAPVAENLASVFTDMNTQVDQFATAVGLNPLLRDGFNLIGISQGALIARAYVERFNRPRVHRLISIVGPQEGIDGCPKTIYPLVCKFFESNPYHPSISFGGYWKDVRDRDQYLKRSVFLADVNNEHDVKNATYKTNMQQLDMYVLAQALNDTVIRPKASELHGFWVWGHPGTTQPMEESPGYVDDWIGLKSLDRAGKLLRFRFIGDHVNYREAAFWKDIVVPLLDDRNDASETPIGIYPRLNETVHQDRPVWIGDYPQRIYY